jgi:hypothetical protein
LNDLGVDGRKTHGPFDGPQRDKDRLRPAGSDRQPVHCRKDVGKGDKLAALAPTVDQPGQVPHRCASHLFHQSIMIVSQVGSNCEWSTVAQRLTRSRRRATVDL